MLSNLYILGNELLKSGRRLHVFLITYNNIQCNVIFHRLQKSNGYYPIQLEFVKIANNEALSCYAHHASTDLKFSEFCRFFNIHLGNGNANVPDIFNSFYKRLNTQIPTTITPTNDVQRHLMKDYIITHSDANEAAKIYLYDFRLNNGLLKGGRM